ncbi:MAG: M12 family metallopeptidase [Bdellovibrio sp.]|nr:M12 family metallopeptidase [Bdellovibrio sp.]
MKLKLLLAFTILVSVFFIFQKNRNLNEKSETITEAQILAANKTNSSKTQKIPTHHSDDIKSDQTTVFNVPASKIAIQKKIKLTPFSRLESEIGELTYTIDEDVAVIQGDIVLGTPPNDAATGKTSQPNLTLWPSGVIPFYIQSNVSNPERIFKALSYFEKTKIHFLAGLNQTDFLVFQESSGNCKSYLGKVGGAQPIWISPNCGVREIIHELMHAIGFIHEQNRSDRNQFLDMLWVNIDSRHKINFDIFSSSLMQLSGLSSFDFESVMLYPDTMFSINNQPTMRPKDPTQFIRPSSALSSKDLERLNLINSD